MLIYRCDRCGVEHIAPQIVGNEFFYAKEGWATLAISAPGVRDVCPTCFNDIASARKHADAKAQALAHAAVLAASKPITPSS